MEIIGMILRVIIVIVAVAIYIACLRLTKEEGAKSLLCFLIIFGPVFILMLAYIIKWVVLGVIWPIIKTIVGVYLVLLQSLVQFINV